MLMISLRDNENNIWIRNDKKNNNKKQTNKQTNKDRKEQGWTEAIVKWWELNGFIVHLSYIFSN